MRDSGRIEEIDLLRGVAALLMILGHSFIVYPIDISGVSWCKGVQYFIYTFHMELFFILAGVVYQCGNYKTFIIKKVKRILIPYIFFGLIAMLGRATGGFFVNGEETLREGMIKLIIRGGVLVSACILYAVCYLSVYRKSF